MPKTPLIWFGNNARMLPTGVIYKSDGVTILASGSSFGVIQTPAGTSPTGSSGADTLILTSSDGSILITGNSGTKTVDYKNPASSAISSTVIDWSLSNVYTKTISGNTTFTFSNTTEKTIVVLITASGSFTATWPTAKWAGGTPPTQTASGTDVYTFIKIGSTFYGSAIQAMA